MFTSVGYQVHSRQLESRYVHSAGHRVHSRRLDTRYVHVSWITGTSTTVVSLNVFVVF